MFHAVDLLLTVPTRAARVLVAKAAPYIASLQAASGGFDDSANEAIALSALRALLTARTLA